MATIKTNRHVNNIHTFIPCLDQLRYATNKSFNDYHFHAEHTATRATDSLCMVYSDWTSTSMPQTATFTLFNSPCEQYYTRDRWGLGDNHCLLCTCTALTLVTDAHILHAAICLDQLRYATDCLMLYCPQLQCKTAQGTAGGVA